MWKLISKTHIMYNCICFNVEIHTLARGHSGLSPYLKHFWSSCMFVSQKMQTFDLYWMLMVDIKIIHFHDSAENGKRGFEWYFEKLRFHNLVLNFWKTKLRPQIFDYSATLITFNLTSVKAILFYYISCGLILIK